MNTSSKTYPATLLISPGQLLREAETADEWLQGLRRLVLSNPLILDTQSPPVRLVCGTIHGRSDVKRLLAIITDLLRLNPFNGEVFAFCDKGHYTITTLTWKEAVFNIGKLPRLHGRYLWPHENMGPSITITSHEFEHLISCYKRSHDRQKAYEIH